MLEPVENVCDETVKGILFRQLQPAVSVSNIC